MVSLANLRDKLSWKRGAMLATLLAASAVAVASSGDSGEQAGAAAPAHASAPAGKCVRDEAYMKRNHMDELKHHRDDTLRKGIRTKEMSLQGCVDCHADKRTNSVLGKDGFCQKCHSYAGVSLDCFECHSSKPKSATPFHPVVSRGAKSTGASGLAGQMKQEMQSNPVEQNTTGGAGK